MNGRPRNPILPLIALIPLIWSGCATLRLPPKMLYATTGATAEATSRSPAAGGPYTLRDTTLSSELMGIHNVRAGAVVLNDTVYVVPSERWLVETFLPYFAQFRKELRLNHRGEGLDCDNFADIFRNQLVFSNIAAGRELQGDVPCGILIAQQREAFGSVPSLGDGFHSLVVIRTENGWLVVEPQDNTMVPLTKYPNKERITSINF